MKAANILGYVGGGFAFLLSFLGAVQNAGQTIFWVEDGIDDWLKGFGRDKYEEVLKDIDRSSAMETFLTWFTWDLIAQTSAEILHSVIILAFGYYGAYMIMNKLDSYVQEYNSMSPREDVPLYKGWILALFGMLYGSINYMAGNVTKETMQSVMLMLGFNEHVGPNPDDEIITTTVVSDNGVSSSTKTSTTFEVVAYDYESLLLLQNEWFNFFAIQRGMQIAAPYLFQLCVEFGILGVYYLGSKYIV